MAFIEFDIERDQSQMIADALDAIKTQFPAWVANEAHLEVALIEELARIASEATQAAGVVPEGIFREFGRELIQVAPIDGTLAGALVTITAVDNAGYVLPIGSKIGYRLTGDELRIFETTAEAVIAAGATQALNVPIKAIEVGTAYNAIASGSNYEMVDQVAWVLTVVSTSASSGGVDAETDQQYIDRLSEELTLMGPKPVHASEFAILARRTAGVYRATAIDGYDPTGNRMTANQSSLETDGTGWAAETNCAVTRSLDFSADGAASLRPRSAAAGDMAAVTPTGVNGFAVTPSEKYTARGEMRQGATARSWRLEISWYNAGGGLLSTSVGSNVAEAANAFTVASLTATAPASAAFAAVRAVVLATGAANEDHYLDRAAFRHGSDTTWKLGAGAGAQDDEERVVSVAGLDSAGVAIAAGVKTQLDTDLEAYRELNFDVHVIDPTATEVDVTTTVKAKEGVDATTLAANVKTAIEDYLNPAKWAGGTDRPPAWRNETVVRYLEIATVIENVEGVERITVTGGNFDLTVNAVRTDVTLFGKAPIPAPLGAGAGLSTVTVTVV